MKNQFLIVHFCSAFRRFFSCIYKKYKYSSVFLFLFFSFSLVQASNVIYIFNVSINNTADIVKVNDLLSQSIKYSHLDYEKALKIADQALKLSKEIKYDIGIIRSNYELGAISISRGQGKMAYSYFKDGLHLSQELNNEPLIAKGFFHMSRYFLEINDYAQSLDYINRALAQFEKLNNKIEISRCYSSLANIFRNLSNFEQSLSYNFKSLEIKEKLGDKKGTSIVLGNIGNVYLLTDKYGEAHNMFSKSLELDRENNDQERIVYSLTRLGVVHQKMEEFEDALGYYKMALPMARELKFRIDESILLGNIGSTLRAQNKYKESLEHLFMALEIKKQLNRSGSAAHTCNDICETYLTMDQVEEAKKFAIKAIEYSKNVNLNQEKYAYNLLSKCDYRLGNFKSSYENLLISNTLKDSIFSIEKMENMNELDVKYQTQNKEKAILTLTKEKQAAEIKMYNYIIAGLITSLVLFVLYYTQRVSSIKRKHMLTKSKEVDLLKSRFFTNISHEFRTPLTLIISPIDELIESAEHIDVKNRLRVIKKNGRRLLDLVNQLLDLSKIESGVVNLETTRSEIINVIKGVYMSFHSMADSKDISLVLEVAEDRFEMNYDQIKFETILTNLLSNAIKFTPDNGQIHIKTSLVSKRTKRKKREFLSIAVTDTGIGIPKEDIGHIFNRFYQSETNLLLQHEGSGIGLAILKELVELHEGKITVNSEIGIGTQIIVLIPTDLPVNTSKINIVQPFAPNTLIEIEDEILMREEEETISVQKPVILLIEDHKEVSNYINDVLGEKYKILNAKDGEEGIILALESIPDLIVSDVMMPKKNGYQVCEALKNDERTSHIPIVLLTAKSSSEDKIEGLSTKADDFVTKPFNPRELLVRIQNLIESRKQLKKRYKKEGLLRPKEITINSIDENFLNRLIELVDENISNENFGVVSLSKAIGMSRSQLHRKLIGLLDQGPNKFIRGYRLQRAHNLLLQNAMTASEISYHVGFGSPSYFTKCFHEHFGYTPSEIEHKSN